MGARKLEDTSLQEADDYVTVRLADGAEVTVHGDGMVYLYAGHTVSDPISKFNLYVNDREEI